MFSETWLDNDESVSIPNFDCCVQFKRSGHRAAGVAIYRKQKNLHVVTPHMNFTYRQTRGLGIVTPKSNRHSRDFLHAAYSYDMETVDFPQHENQQTRAGVEPATFGAEG
ncbi:hypothetical protein TNCV_4192661 [Trichonephila clavipes]|nr:hypothetical protein TNCV_4192661 [Trichonephila clavipes]